MERKGLTTLQAGQLLVGRQGGAGGQATGQRGALASAQEGTGIPSRGGDPSWEGAPHATIQTAELSGYGLKSAGEAKWAASGVGGEDTSGCREAGAGSSPCSPILRQEQAKAAFLAWRWERPEEVI